ncbi:MAG: type III pantothenate kinase [Oscillospiraceae bacterium]|nr:type III pantothenate kinase [Oscillospiraceae bacterium]
MGELLAVDIGNTNIVLGRIRDGEILNIARLVTDRGGLHHDYALRLGQTFAMEGIDPGLFGGAIIASVVPQATNAVREAIRRLLGLESLVVGPEMRTNMTVALDDPGSLAADLIAGAVGGLACYEPPLIIVDMGTATTISVIDGDRRFLGGAIMPGVGVSLSALTAGTSLLPGVSLEAPARCIGANTEDCMKSGAVYGAACQIDGMTARMEAELGRRAAVIATGGLARGIVPLCQRDIRYDPDLLLKGLWALYEMNGPEA